MTIEFTVSAPGKIILNGEHSVVYNKPALAGVIGLRTHVNFKETDHDYVNAIFDLFPNASPTYQLSDLNKFFSEIQLKYNVDDLLNELTDEHDEFLALVQQFVYKTTQLNDITDEQMKLVHKCMTGIIYLLTALQISHARSNGLEPFLTRGFTIQFKSEIPIGAGLGSSAAFAVCLSAAFYIYTMSQMQSNFIKTFNDTATNDERQQLNNVVSSWAFLSERIMHGTPSGLDNTVCTFGNVVQFIKNPKSFVNVAVKSTINIMLVNTGVSRNTVEIVRKVKELRDVHAELIDHILDAMGALVKDVIEILENKTSATDEENYMKLKRLFSINNNLLRALGVSHPVLEEIFSISERFNFGAKLTGAGAGGFAIILLPPLYKESEAFHNLCNELSKFETTITTIGGPGLLVSE